MSLEWRIEDPLDSCKAIIHFIEAYSTSDDLNAIRNALLEDLCSKAKGITTSDKSAMLARAMYYSLPSRLRELYSEKSLGLAELTELAPPSRRRKSVGIITVIDTELDATLRVFEAPSPPAYRDENFEYWFSEIEGHNDSHLSIVISNVGQARNVPCAIAVDHLLSRYPSDLMILIGIAAGPPEKVTLGDVVLAHRVYDYEHVRAEILQKRKVKSPRPLFLEVDPTTRLDLKKLTQIKMREKFESVLSRSDVSVPVNKDGPVLHRGTVAAGEMLIADGSLDEMRLRVDNEIRAGDQEDSGFAQACRLNSVPWCIFRGISDYGNPEKDNTWQLSAALAAASAAYSFLKDCYIPPVNVKTRTTRR